jgi:hypothetical protein
MIKDLEKRKDKAMQRSDTDDYRIKIESLQWVLFVIFASSGVLYTICGLLVPLQNEGSN